MRFFIVSLLLALSHSPFLHADSSAENPESDTTERTEKDPYTESSLDLGGAVRLNYSWQDYSDDSNGRFEFELFRIDVKAQHERWFLDAQYRWYQGFDAVHHAKIGYHFSKSQSLTVGVSQVPFGIQPYASHSFWFGGTYYLGLEDDYDAGIAWKQNTEKLQFDLAYFTGSEYDDAGRFGRYSFDIATSDDKANKEEGQLNGRLQYQLTPQHTVGLSAQYGTFKNTLSQDTGNRWAVGAHIDSHIENWNFQAQLIKYNYQNKATLDTADGRIALSAFLFPFEISTEAWVTSLNAAYTFEMNNDFVDSITCYNDLTLINPPNDPGLTDSTQNVSGCLFAKGGLYTYVDWIAGDNMWFAGGPGVGIDNGDNQWHSRLNINFGFYF